MRNLCQALLCSRWTATVGLLVCAFILISTVAYRWSRHRLPRAYLLGERGIQGGSLERGKAELEAYLAEHPEDHYALRLYGVTLLNLGEKEQGVFYLERSLEVNPHQPSVARYLRTVGHTPDVPPCPEAATPELAPSPPR